MNKWPHEIKSYTPEEVRKYAVADKSWQQFRLSLKGLSTSEKLQRLGIWRHRGTAISRSTQVQVDNYINALKRGGQLDKDGKVVR
jgi:hypothetical protein